MKQLFTVFALLITTWAFSQTTFRVGITTNVIPYESIEFFDVVQLNDGSYVCVGRIAGDEFYAYIVKLNAQGQLLYSKSILSDEYQGFSEFENIIKTSDGNIAVIGLLNFQIALFEFDPDLNLLWNKVYSTTADYVGSYGLIQTSDGGYMITGFLYTYNDNSDYAGLIIKTTSEGSVSWVKRYSEFTNSYNGSMKGPIDDIVKTKDGNYLFLGESPGIHSDDLDTNYLVKIDSVGNIIWSKRVTFPYKWGADYLISASDGGFVIGGSTIDFSSTDQMMLIKFSEDGNVIWGKRSDNEVNFDGELRKILEDADGGYIAGGFIVANYNYIFKVNSNGTVQWTKAYPDVYTYKGLYSIIRTNDGGYAASGSTGNDETTVNYGTLFKFDSGFNICGNANSFGTFTDLTVTAASINLPVKDVPFTADSGHFTVSSPGTLTDICSLLPLQLLSFSAALQNKTVSLQWKTANEINTDHFIVERSNNGTTFTALQQVKAAGNSTGIQTYAVKDAQPLSGTSYYRLKELDKDGSFTYSSIATVTVIASGTMVIRPNPVHNNISLMLQSTTNGNASVLITDITGKVVIHQQAIITVGTNNIIIPASSLSKGMYIIKVIQNDQIQSAKFIKQ